MASHLVRSLSFRRVSFPFPQKTFSSKPFPSWNRVPSSKHFLIRNFNTENDGMKFDYYKKVQQLIDDGTVDQMREKFQQSMDRKLKYKSLKNNVMNEQHQQRNFSPTDMINLFQEMRQNRIEINLQSYLDYFKRLKKLRIEDFRNILNQISRDNIPIEAPIFKAALKVIANQDHLNERDISSFSLEMSRYQIPEDEEILIQKMKGFARMGNTTKVKELQNQLLDMNKDLLKEEFIIIENIILESMFVSRQFESLESHFQSMKQQNKIDVHTMNQMILTLAELNKLDEIDPFVKEMQTSHGIQPNITTYTSLIHVYTKYGQKEDAEKWFQEAKEKGISFSFAIG